MAMFLGFLRNLLCLLVGAIARGCVNEMHFLLLELSFGLCGVAVLAFTQRVIAEIARATWAKDDWSDYRRSARGSMRRAHAVPSMIELIALYEIAYC